MWRGVCGVPRVNGIEWGGTMRGNKATLSGWRITTTILLLFVVGGGLLVSGHDAGKILEILFSLKNMYVIIIR